MHAVEYCCFFSSLVCFYFTRCIFVCTSFRRVFFGYNQSCLVVVLLLLLFFLQKLRLFYERLKSISEHHNLDTLFLCALSGAWCFIENGCTDCLKAQSSHTCIGFESYGTCTDTHTHNFLNIDLLLLLLLWFRFIVIVI